MECRTPNDIYLLLKSSDFITHDLEQVFDGCEPSILSTESPNGQSEIPYRLVLRKTIPAFITSLEFRCFIRSRTLLCICQRDLNHYGFLPALVPVLRPLIQEFLDEVIRKFPDENFVVDVYIPPPHKRVWLIDINPWAPRTDPLLFSWMEILDLPSPRTITTADTTNGTTDAEEVSEDEGDITFMAEF
ncbi:MAG: hypothetical protein Q9181_007827, partial [Wetmoreana brouardii]